MTTAAEDTLKYFKPLFVCLFFFSEKIGLDISCESSCKQTIHMKCLFFLFFFWKIRQSKLSSATISVGNLRVQKLDLTFHVNCLPRRRAAWNVKYYFLEKKIKIDRRLLFSLFWQFWGRYWYDLIFITVLPPYNSNPHIIAILCISITKTCLFKYTKYFTTKKWKFSDKILWYFSYFCSKHRLLVRTASMRRF